MTAAFDPTTYGPALAPLLAGDRLNDLGPGAARRGIEPALRGLTVGSAFAHARVADAESARACLAGVWLLHDFLDESHALGQELPSAEGSFWHAIMHRREPDASNSKYWWRRVGGHPVLDLLRGQAPALGYSFKSPADFVDFCERVRGTRSAEEDIACRVQRLEWELLFDHCYRAAIG